METRKYTKRREMVDYNSVVANLTNNDIVVCLPVGLLHIVRKFLKTRALWRTTYVKSYVSKSEYEIPTTGDMEPIERAIFQFLEDTNEMNCNELIDALNSIADAKGACCSEGSGSVSPGEPYSDFEDDGVNPPDGFQDYPTYDTHKCDTSQWWIDSVVQDITWLKTLDYAAIGTTTLAAGLIIPGVNVGILLGLLLYLVALAALAADLQDIIDWVQASDSDLRCDIYNSTNATDAAANIETRIEGSTLSTLEAEILTLFVTSGSINAAFENSNIPSQNADCSSCGCPNFHLAYGIEVVSPLQQTDSQPFSGREQVSVYRNHDGASYCGGYETLENITWLSGLQTDPNFRVRAWDQNNGLLFDQASNNAFDNFVATLPRADVGRVLFNRASGEPEEDENFSIDIDWSW